MNLIYNSINELLKTGKSFVIATILEKSGSTPREAGTKMIIKDDMSIIGTIGGGIFEAFTIKLAHEVFKTGKAVTKDFVLSDEDASMEGMVCGGKLKVLLEYFEPRREDICSTYEQAFNLYEKEKDFVILTEYCDDHHSIKWLITENGVHDEICPTDDPIFTYIQSNFRSLKFHNLLMNGKTYLIEPVFSHDTVYIFGAGHVANKLARITKFIGFNTVVLDDRMEFANRSNFETADDIIVLDSFENAFSNIKIDEKSYIVIVTRGHMNDKDVLAQALKTNAAYIGMIGSIKKRDFIYNQLLDEGFTNDDFKRVHCPVGLKINAETPEEIGISIAAEMIMFKRG